MTDGLFEHRSGLDRRTFLANVTSVTTATIAGCGKIQNREPKGEASQFTSTPTTKGYNEPQDELEELIEDISSVYNRLTEHPIIEDSEFVFRVKAFENNFDQNHLFSDADVIVERLESRKSHEGDRPRIKALISITELAKILARQRGIVHQVIAAGLVFHQRINQGEYEDAVVTIQNAQRFVVDLQRSVNQILERIGRSDWSVITVDKFDPESIRTSQIKLLEICLWTKLAFKGLNQAAQGIRRFEDGNDELESKRYTNAEAAYEESYSDFESSVEAFDKAQGHGTQLPHLVPVVEGFRCLMPAYTESSRSLTESMDKFRDGNEESARKIAREALVTADKKASRCF